MYHCRWLNWSNCAVHLCVFSLTFQTSMTDTVSRENWSLFYSPLAANDFHVFLILCITFATNRCMCCSVLALWKQNQRFKIQSTKKKKTLVTGKQLSLWWWCKHHIILWKCHHSGMNEWLDWRMDWWFGGYFHVLNVHLFIEGQRSVLFSVH